VAVEADLSLTAMLSSGGDALLGANDFHVVIPAGQSSYTVTLNAPANFMTLVQNLGFSLAAELVAGTNTQGGTDAVTYSGASMFTTNPGVTGVSLTAPTNGQPLINLAQIQTMAADPTSTGPVTLNPQDIVDLAGAGGTVSIQGSAGQDVGLANATNNPGEQVWFRLPGSDAAGFDAYSNGSVTVQVKEGMNVGTVVEGTTAAETIRGGVGNDTFDGGAGVDTLNLTELLTGANTWSPVTQGLSVNLGTGTLTDTTLGGLGNDVILNIENLVTGAGDDTLTGSVFSNVIDAGAGNDVINAGAGDDTVLAGDGNDSVLASIGNDSLDGGTGTNTLQAIQTQLINGVLTDVTGNLTVNMATGTLTGRFGHRQLHEFQQPANGGRPGHHHRLNQQRRH
jgi:Ca2+-binding RTX toxin-like protein